MNYEVRTYPVVKTGERFGILLDFASSGHALVKFSGEDGYHLFSPKEVEKTDKKIPVKLSVATGKEFDFVENRKEKRKGNRKNASHDSL